MFVITDLEWVKRNAIYPTQLAAIRVNPSWEVVDRFAMLIRPSFHNIHWNHVAFTGYERDDFRNAYRASAVFTHFRLWLKDDDTLVWWIAKPAEAFLLLANDLLKATPRNRMLLVKPSVNKVLSQVSDTTSSIEAVRKATQTVAADATPDYRQSAYDVADILGLRVTRPEHDAVNDVSAIRCVCAHLCIDQAAVTTRLIVADLFGQHQSNNICQYSNNGTDVHYPDRDQPIKDKLTKRIDLPYYYDHKTNLLHSKDCSMLPHDVNGHVISAPLLTGHGSLKNCIRERLVPCACCKEQYHTLDKELRQSVIASTNFSYVYRIKSSVFHKPSCYQVARIPFMDVRGATYYDTCLENGKRPCGWCKPTRSDEKEPPHLYPTDMLMGEDFISKDDQKKMWVDMSQEQWGATRRLTEEEKVALKRHKTAAKERSQKPQNMTTQQTNDFFTLTQPRFAFWAQEGYSTFHLRNCKKMGGLSNLKGFEHYSDAIRFGYKPCRFCKPTSKSDIILSVPIYQRRRDEERVEDIDALCDKLGWEHTYTKPNYFIETPAGKWKMVTGTRPVDVYHINKVTQPGETNFHKQHRLFISMTDTVEYIRKHDDDLIQGREGAATDGLTSIVVIPSTADTGKTAD